jgi:hypothetical protein
MHSEALVHVFLAGAFPTYFLFVLPVAELEVVLHCFPVDGLGSGQSDAIVGSAAEQVQPIVLVEEVHDHGLYSADDGLSVLEVGQFDGGVLLPQSGQVLLLPLLFGQEDVLLLPVGDEDVLEHEPNHLQLTPDRPVHQRHLLLFRDLLLLRQFLQLLLLRLLLLLPPPALLVFRLLLVLLSLACSLRKGEKVVFRLAGLRLRLRGDEIVELRVGVGMALSVQAVGSVHAVLPAETANAARPAQPHPGHAPQSALETSSETTSEPTSKPASESSAKSTSQAESSSDRPWKI